MRRKEIPRIILIRQRRPALMLDMVPRMLMPFRVIPRRERTPIIPHFRPFLARTSSTVPMLREDRHAFLGLMGVCGDLVQRLPKTLRRRIPRRFLDRQPFIGV